MLFYINLFYGDHIALPSKYPNNYIGLFSKCETKGEGSFCGYYGAEYYLDTTLYAHYDAEGRNYAPEKRISDVRVCNIHCDKISIGSGMWTKVIEADTVEEAVEKFKNAQWRDHRWSDYEITVEQELSKYDTEDYRHAMVRINDGNRDYLYIDEEIEYISHDILEKIVQCGPTISVDNGKITIELMI